jgi:hypothetical protein
MFVIIARACGSCGSEQAVLVLETKPTEKDEYEVRRTLGGMFCISTHTFEVEPGEIETYKPED